MSASRRTCCGSRPRHTGRRSSCCLARPAANKQRRGDRLLQRARRLDRPLQAVDLGSRSDLRAPIALRQAAGRSLLLWEQRCGEAAVLAKQHSPAYSTHQVTSIISVLRHGSTGEQGQHGHGQQSLAHHLGCRGVGEQRSRRLCVGLLYVRLPLMSPVLALELLYRRDTGAAV